MIRIFVLPDLPLIPVLEGQQFGGLRVADDLFLLGIKLDGAFGQCRGASHVTDGVAADGHLDVAEGLLTGLHAIDPVAVMLFSVVQFFLTFLLPNLIVAGVKGVPAIADPAFSAVEDDLSLIHI